ncbi:MAG: GDP-mannose 4,6-dehydratase [Candidatus Omnitrophota bacterium]
MLANEKVIVFNDQEMHMETIEKYFDSKDKKRIIIEEEIYVPAFDPGDCRMKLYKVDALIKHPCDTDCYEVSLRYGRKVKVTGDHSVFTKGTDSKPVAIPVRNLKIGDYVAMPSKLPAVERDFVEFSIAGALIKHCKEKTLWDYLIISPELKTIITNRREEINGLLLNSGRFNAERMRNGIVCSSNKYKHASSLPLWVIKKLDIKIPKDAKIRSYTAGSHIITTNNIKITNDILWLIGFYLAEGCSYYKKGKSYFLTFCSDQRFLDKAEKILIDNFGVHVIKVPHSKNRGPAIFIHSKVLHFIFEKIFNVLGAKGFPVWVFQLPLPRLKYVLEGFKDGDGTHSGKKVGKELCFETVSKKMVDDLTFLLLRFGIVASVGKYSTTFKKKYGLRKFPFYRVTICEISTFNILKWDKGVRQRLNSAYSGDLVWSKVKSIRKCKPTRYVYDFSVPNAENFIAGNGICCHNTYGPRMRKQDGRAIPNFISQAQKNEPITVYGKGDQTRSFCYVSDLIEGIYLLSQSDIHDPVNIGNPVELKIIDMAKKIIKMTGSKSKITHNPLPQDDPKVRQPDITKAKNLLNWKPKVGLEEGLKETIEWFNR